MNTTLEVADVFRDGEDRFRTRYGKSLLRSQRQVLRAVVRCRTAALGGHVGRCDDCGHQQIQYNSCRNRHCPKCQAMARAAWLEKRESELLPVPYFHVVFTLPHQLAPLALQNQRVVYGILFQAAAQTLLEIAADPKHLGARIGCLMVLHTWGQNLMHHPHVHAVVTGGGLSADGSRWVHIRTSRRRQTFFAPVKILSRVFRGKFIALLKAAFAAGKLGFYGQLQPLSDLGSLAALRGLPTRGVTMKEKRSALPIIITLVVILAVPGVLACGGLVPFGISNSYQSSPAQPAVMYSADSLDTYGETTGNTNVDSSEGHDDAIPPAPVSP